MNKEEYQKMMQRRKERRMALAAESNTRVRRVDSIDTMVILDIQPAADRCFSMIRRYQGVLPKYSIEKTAPLIDEWYRIVMDLHRWTEKACELTGVKYHVPRIIKRMLAAQKGGGGNGDGVQESGTAEGNEGKEKES